MQQTLSFQGPVLDGLRKVEETLRQASQVSGFEHLAQYLDHILDFGGKQIRPALTLLSAKFHPHDERLTVLMASAIELLHIATLVHDDTIDKAVLRRGRPTVSSVWGKDVAMLLGDYVFAKSATLVCDTNNVRVVKLFAETIMALSSGELREYVTGYDWKQTREQYETRIRDKTASLFETACETGAILSGAPEGHVSALRQYGYNLGMSYQVVDDILDYRGSQEEVGKPVGSDLSQGVITLPAILLQERQPSDTSIKAVFGDRESPEKLSAAVERIRESGVLEEASRAAEEYCDQARQSLSALPQCPAKDSLAEITRYVTERNR